MIEFRRATRADVLKFTPEMTHSFRAIAAVKDGRVLGVGGIYYAGDAVVAFSAYDPEMDNHKFAKLRAVKKIMRIIGDRRCIAIASDKHEGSEDLLQRIGFERIEGRVFEWNRKQQLK